MSLSMCGRIIGRFWPVRNVIWTVQTQTMRRKIKQKFSSLQGQMLGLWLFLRTDENSGGTRTSHFCLKFKRFRSIRMKQISASLHNLVEDWEHKDLVILLDYWNSIEQDKDEDVSMERVIEWCTIDVSLYKFSRQKVLILRMMQNWCRRWTREFLWLLLSTIMKRTHPSR